MSGPRWRQYKDSEHKVENEYEKNFLITSARSHKWSINYNLLTAKKQKKKKTIARGPFIVNKYFCFGANWTRFAHSITLHYTMRSVCVVWTGTYRFVVKSRACGDWAQDTFDFHSKIYYRTSPRQMLYVSLNFECTMAELKHAKAILRATIICLFAAVVVVGCRYRTATTAPTMSNTSVEYRPHKKKTGSKTKNAKKRKSNATALGRILYTLYTICCVA